eukprot:4771710-Amphidinium_carterae.1
MDNTTKEYSSETFFRAPAKQNGQHNIQELSCQPIQNGNKQLPKLNASVFVAMVDQEAMWSLR